MELMQSGTGHDVQQKHQGLIEKIYGDDESDDVEVLPIQEPSTETIEVIQPNNDKYSFAEEIEEEETLSLHDKELELIKKSLERHKGKRKLAAAELGISERTLYRKIKQFDL
jgi:transcriptional regulator with PAS, ATPase and Fis domain